MTTTSTEQAEKPSALVIMARQLSVEPQKLYATLRDTVFKGATDSELLALVVISNTYGLNPLLREIYAFPAKGGGITPVVSIDGWISMVNRQSEFDGLDFSFESDGEGAPIACTCTIYVKGRSHPVRVTEFFKECFRATEPWKQMPRRMLRHKALKEAARVAFGFSGVTDEDEARDIANRQFPPGRRVIVEKPDFAKAKPAEATEIKHEASGTKSDDKQPGPEPAEPATVPKPEKKGKTTVKGEKAAEEVTEEKKSPCEALYDRLYESKIKPDQFLADLKLIKFPGTQSDHELLSELPAEVCEAILASSLEGLLEQIRDARWLEEQK